MPENTISVKVTADVTDAKTNLAVAQASMRQFNSAVTASAKVAATASEEQRAAARAQLQVAVEAAERQTVVVNSLKATVAAASAEIAGSNERVQTSFGKLHESVRIAGEGIEGLSAKLSVYEGLASSVGELVAVGFGVEAIAEQVNKVAELGESYAQLSEKTGATIQQLGGLRLAAMETNTDFDTVGNGLRELGIKMQEAIAQPSSQAAEAFQRAGISIQDSAGNMLPVLDVFTQITAKMATYQDGAAKTALAGDMLGAKFGSTLIPMMNQVGDQFAELEAKAQALGLTMSTETVEASEKFIESQKDAGAAATGLRTEIVGGSLPAFAALEQEFIISAQSGGVLSDAAQVLDVGLRVVTEAALLTVTAVTDIADAATYVGNVFGDVALAADGLAFALEGKFALASAAVKVATTDIGTSWSNMLQKMDEQGKLFASTSSQLLGNVATLDAQPAKIAAPGLSGAVSMGDRQGVAGLDNSNAGGNTYDYSGGGDGGVSKAKSAQDQLTQIAQDAAEARKQISDSEYQAQVSNWDAEVAQGQMTKAQEIQAEISAQNQMYQAALAEETKEAALDAAGTAAKAKALDDIAVLTASHNAEIASLNTQLVTQQVEDAKTLADANKAAAEASQEAWQKAFQPITQAFDASVNGVLQGTQTLQQAEVKAAQSIALAFIDAEAKKLEAFVVSEAAILARSLANEVAMTTATIAGNTARMAAKTSADAAGRAEDVALGTAQINASAMKAAAGAFSAVAGIPYVGPVLAPIAATTAYAAVMAYDVLSASGGLALGPGENPVVQLHENETVLPAHIAQPLNNWLSNSSTDNSSQSNVNLNLNQHIHGGGAGVDAGMMRQAGNAVMNSIIDLTRNGTLRLPGRG